VKDPKAPWNGKVEKEYTITLSDWYEIKPAKKTS